MKHFKVGDTVFVHAPPPNAPQPRRGQVVHLGRKWASVFLGDRTVPREIASLR
jgi:hypothetical protein